MDTMKRGNESWGQKLSTIQKTFTVAVLGVTMAVVLAACGGGGTTSSSVSTTLTGNLIDGYISGAKVCLDVNSNGVCDTGEPYATTATSGVFSISVPSGTSTTGKNLVAFIPTTATDTDGPITTAYTMLAPVPAASTSTIVSPLTTIVALNPASGVAGVATALGVSQATITADYIANASSSTTGAHNVAHFLAAVLASAQGAQSSVAPNSPSILSAVNAVATSTNLTAAAGASSTSLTSLITSATAVPGAPTIGTATGGNGQATVTFTAPSSAGGSAITGYTVTSSPAGGTDSNAGSATLSHTITGLTNGTSYMFTVHANNATGQSAESGLSNAVTPVGPTTAATAPAHTVASSILTSSANDIAGTNFRPDWGQATQYAATTVGGVETAAYSALNYEGVQLAANINVSTATTVHFDIWTPNVTSLQIGLISINPGTNQFLYTSALTAGVWNSIDIPLSSFTGVDLTGINQLSFTGVTPSAGGIIFVQNIYFWGSSGVASTAPSAPTIGTATGGNGQATVTFTAPSSTGGSAITGYTVTSIPSGGTDSNAGTTSLTHTITGLTNGTSYTFTVKATNSVGTSAASAASNAVTPAVPSGGATVTTASSWALGGTHDFGGVATSIVTSQPAGGLASNAAMAVIPAGSQYDGTTFLTIANAEFCSATHPTLSLEVYAPAAGKTIDLKLEQDGDVTKNIEMFKTSVVGWQTLTFNCTTDSGKTAPGAAGPTAGYVEATVYNKMSVLFDFLPVSPGETWYFDQLAYTPTAATTYVAPAPFAAPTAAAAGPAHTIIKSVLTTSANDNVGVTNFRPDWGQPTVYTPITVGGVETVEYSSLSYEGIQLAAITNVSAATHVHYDVWSNVTSLDFALINSAVATGAAGVEFHVIKTLTTGWNSIDIPLTSFTGGGVDLTKVDQLSFTDKDATNGGTIYIQNLYFY